MSFVQGRELFFCSFPIFQVVFVAVETLSPVLGLKCGTT